MGKFSPVMADKGKWTLKVGEAVKEDCNRHEGIAVGYSVVYFDPFTKDPDKMWSFAIRLGHSREYMDKDQKMRLDAALKYVAAGIQKIFNVDAEELRKMMEEECVKDFEVRGTFH